MWELQISETNVTLPYVFNVSCTQVHVHHSEDTMYLVLSGG